MRILARAPRAAFRLGNTLLRATRLLPTLLVCKIGWSCIQLLGRSAMPRFAKSLFGQVVIALVLGVLAGLFAPEFAVKLKPLGDAFIKLIKMIIPVLVFC